MRLALVLLMGISCSGNAEPLVVTTQDTSEKPYRWSDVRCILGKSDLSIASVSKEDEPGQVHFYFRNLSTFLKSLHSTTPTELNVKSTDLMGLTFQDRMGTVFAFQPKRNQAQCQLQMKKTDEGGLVLWGKCLKLLPRNDSFFQDIEISEQAPLKCQLSSGTPERPTKPQTEEANP